MGSRHLAWPYRPTPGLKAKPQGPRPNPSPPGVVAWAFYPNPSPIPHGLSAIKVCCNTMWLRALVP
ncbi:hypothetical protein HanRHA438_Chr14g0666181 [Helianthus annuus]|nr:hypothetical protein HanRHA438_Chr14g0666181 [Helianthus annuus]